MAYTLSVVIPAYNESKTINQTVTRLLESLNPLSFELVIVDDCSKDSTAEIIRALAKEHDNIHLYQHVVNKGKTEALKTGFQYCQGEVVIVQDADLEYDPRDIVRLVQPIIDGKSDVVYGSRMSELQGQNKFMFKSLLANKVLTLISNIFTRYKFSDVETCYKAFRRPIVQNMIITSKRFGFEIEVTAKISKLRLRASEMPISYNSRSYAEGKKIGFKDALQAFFYILEFNLFTSLKQSFTQIPDLSRE